MLGCASFSRSYAGTWTQPLTAATQTMITAAVRIAALL
ncbi:MAG: hypothetical protein RL701_5959 [Pseudomonadota bacterium]|jgi:hypothetical protein